MDTAVTLSAVLDEVQLSEPYFNMFVVTGDIAQDTVPETYKRFDRMVHAECIPTWCIPGNHDDPEMMREVFSSDNLRLNGHVEAGSWLLVFLDSHLAGSPAGELGEKELARLEGLLELHENKHAMILMHHHPLPCGCEWLDKIGLQDNQALLDLIARFPNVKALLCGHIHQEMEQDWNGVRVIGSPSTCVQFKPMQTQFTLDTQPPGYRWLELHTDGSINTGVKYVISALKKTA